MEKHAEGSEPAQLSSPKMLEDDGIAWAFEQLHIIRENLAAVLLFGGTAVFFDRKFRGIPVT